MSKKDVTTKVPPEKIKVNVSSSSFSFARLGVYEAYDYY